ncbi:hypothetical protein NHX12_022710 [Muraenolepis orangiensis]|uniref:Uncharacterized protein n=1 Tax=Muraenolepis orangiensis TaxID=630683 RepID=A0A9Q0IUL0_9TELE|nr:hypothetical protein NHX12_022710 [Muraenolepis orangiensis]
MVDAKGRNMKCLTFLLMLPESVKSRSSKSSGSSKAASPSGSSKLPPVCYEIIALKGKKKKKMAADIFPAKKSPSGSDGSGGGGGSSSGGSSGSSGSDSTISTTITTTTTMVHPYQQQNLNNNNTVQNCNWQGLYSTIRERNSVMFNNELMADVHFLVGQPGGTERLPGHRVRLSSSQSWHDRHRRRRRLRCH